MNLFNVIISVMIIITLHEMSSHLESIIELLRIMVEKW